MGASPIDYEALARRAGALISQPAGVDYTALAAKAGALASRPAAMVPDAGAQMRSRAVGSGAADIREMDQIINGPPETADNRGALESAWDLVKGGVRGLAALPGESLSPTLTAENMKDVPVQTVATADRQVRSGNYAGAAGTVLGAGVAIAAPALIIHAAGKAAGLAGRGVGRVLNLPAGVLEPQLDAAEARGVQYGHEEGVQMPASVQSGSPAIAHGEKVLQHFPLASKVAKTARAAEQSTLAAAGAREVAGLGSPDAGAVPSAIDVGEAIHGKVSKLQADHAAAGAQLSGSAPSMLDAGESVNRASQGAVDAHGATADNSYDLFRSIESQPQFKAKLQTGTRRVPTGDLDAGGAPVYKTEPVIEDIQLPVDRRPAQLALKPVLARMLRLMPVAQEQSSVGIKALRNIVEGPAFESASITDEDLGAIKGIIRDSGDAKTVGLAKMAVDQLGKAVDAAAERAGPEAVAALKKGRESTVAKYRALDFQKDLGYQNAGMYGAAPGEPVGVANSVLKPGDRSVNLLRSVAEHAPEQIPVLGDTLAHDLVTQVRNGDAAGAVRKWNSYGEATKGILYPEGEAPAAGGAKPPSKAAAIDAWLNRAAELENVKKSLPASDALVSNIVRGGERGTNTLRTIAAHAPEHIPALAQRVVQDLIDTGTAEAGMGKPQSVLREWSNIGDEKKDILFRDPYPNTGEGPRVQRLTDFFTLMKKLGENPNPSGSGAMLAMVKGVGLVITAPHIGIPVLLGSKAAARMLFNPESSRWMTQALKMPATAKGAPLLANQIIRAAGPDVTPAAAAAAPATPSTAGAIAPEASPVQSSGGGGSTNGQSAGNTGGGGPAPNGGAVRDSATAGAGTAGLKKRPNVTTVELAGKPGQGYKARYVLEELDNWQASHNGLTFEENPKYELGKQQRNYKDPVNQEKILVGSSDAGHNPRLHVEPSVDTGNGPPIGDERRNTLSGNGRDMMQQRIWAAGGKAAERLRAAIAREAAQIEGLNPDDALRMKRPALRLVIDDEEFERRGPDAKHDFIADANEPGTNELTPGERMISDARRVSESTLQDVGGRLESHGPEATIGEILDGRGGPEILEKLIEDGVIARRSRAALVKTTKERGLELTPAGKDRVTKLLVGRFFTDPEQITKLPAVASQVERVTAPLSQVDGLKEWSLTAPMQEAVGILEHAHDLGSKNLEDFFQQDGIFGAAKYSAEAVDLARALKSAPAEAIKGAARQYAGDAVEASRGASMFGETSTPADAFKAAFSPEALEKRAAELKAARDAARKPKANALASSKPEAPAPKNSLADKGPAALTPDETVINEMARRRYNDPNQRGLDFDAPPPADPSQPWHRPTPETLHNSVRFEQSRNVSRIRELETKLAGLGDVEAKMAELNADNRFGEAAELEFDAQDWRKELAELKGRNEEIKSISDFYKERGDDPKLTAFAKETQVGNAPAARRIMANVVAKLHSEYPKLAASLEKQGIIKKLLIGEQALDAETKALHPWAAGLAWNDGSGRLWVSDTDYWGRGEAAKPLWEHHSVSGYAISKADGHLSTFIHESGHHYHYADENLQWQGPGTDSAQLEYLYEKAKRDDKLITKYAGTNTHEYFAESFTAAVKHPAQLKLRDPQMYGFMRQFLKRHGIAELPAK